MIAASNSLSSLLNLISLSPTKEYDPTAFGRN
jgi:hypothetical protein